MLSSDLLTEVFDRGLTDGFETLSPADRDLFRIQNFILEYEMEGLSGYFYNHTPELNEVRQAVAAMRSNGLTELAQLLEEASDLFAGYSEPEPPSTWGEVCSRYDPNDRLSELEKRIRELNGYGIG